MSDKSMCKESTLEYEEEVIRVLRRWYEQNFFFSSYIEASNDFKLSYF